MSNARLRAAQTSIFCPGGRREGPSRAAVPRRSCSAEAVRAFGSCFGQRAPQDRVLTTLARDCVRQAEKLLDRGIHPLRVAEGYEKACKISTANLEKIATKFTFSKDNLEPLIQTCMTTLSSKMCGALCRPFVLPRVAVSGWDTLEAAAWLWHGSAC